MLAAVFGPTPGAPGDPVGGVAAQRDEVRHLLRVDAVALAHLGRPDPRKAAPAHRLEDGHAVADELEGVAVRGGDEHRPVPVRAAAARKSSAS